MQKSKLELIDMLSLDGLHLFCSYDSQCDGFGSERFNFNYTNHRDSFPDDNRCPISDEQIWHLKKDKCVRVEQKNKVIVYFIGVAS